MDRTSDVMTVQLLSPCQLALESLRIVEVLIATLNHQQRLIFIPIRRPTISV